MSLKNNSELSQITSMAVTLLGLPQNLIHKCEAVAVYPGLEDRQRVIQAIKTFEENQPRMKNLLVSGEEKSMETHREFNLTKLQKPPYNLRTVNGVICRYAAYTTKDQCDWICLKVKQLGIRSLTLTTAPFHILRVYLTQLKSFLNHNIEPPIMIPLPTLVSSSKKIFDTNHNTWSMIPAEMDKIITYQQKGHVACFKEFQKYINSIWERITIL